MPTAAQQSIATEATDDEIDAIIAECGGDPREAIRALLHDMAALAIDAEAAVSRGYARRTRARRPHLWPTKSQPGPKTGSWSYSARQCGKNLWEAQARLAMTRKISSKNRYLDWRAQGESNPCFRRERATS
jgi:hypothetical protein